MNEYLVDARRYDALADAGTIERIVSYLGVALRNRDSATVACSDDGELRTVRESWCAKKLGSDDPRAIERAVGLVCRTMSSDRMKNRATFYYLCAKHLRKLEAF